MEIQKAVIDRFEGEQAILLVGDKENQLVVNRRILPKGANEGDWLKVEIQNKRILSVVIDAGETAAVKSRIEEKLAALRHENHLNE